MREQATGALLERPSRARRGEGRARGPGKGGLKTGKTEDGSPALSATRHGGASVFIGKILALAESGEPLVSLASNAAGRGVKARTTVPVGKADVGGEAVLVFEGGDRRRPIILGVLKEPGGVGQEREAVWTVETVSRRDAGKGEARRTVTAEKELVLQCGKASIILTNAGKILIRGAYILSRSSGVNRIKGGSVQIN